MRQPLPIGIQSFEKLRSDNYKYVDKTGRIFDLIQTSMPYFLSRPRRFGKSLLLSTIKAYFEGKEELFNGLEIEKLEATKPDPWQSYPVFYFDFNKSNYNSSSSIDDVLDAHLTEWEQIYSIHGTKDDPLPIRFQKLIRRAVDHSGKRCVILVDEYDKPLLDSIEENDLVEHNRSVFRGFFSVLKSYDEYIRFAMITGVTKFSKISIFRDLNNLRDISLSAGYADICGITESELTGTFAPELSEMAEYMQISDADCLEKLRKTYDGYLFHPRGNKVYNPYSLLSALSEKEFKYYWFETGTPIFLVRQLKSRGFDIRKFTDGTLYANSTILSDYRTDNPDLLPLLYQTGYLTITDYDQRTNAYILGFPNEEVKYGFLECLLPAYVPASVAGTSMDIYTLNRYVADGDTEGIRDVLISLFASIPYTSAADPFEHYFQTVIYIVFTMLGQFVQCEMHTSNGRIDCVLMTERYIYLFEFKRDKSAEEALQQIETKAYADRYTNDQRTVIRIGVNFDSAKRNIDEWEVQV